MKTYRIHALAAAAIAFGWMTVPGAAGAASDTATRHAELREACTDQGGRFEQSWRYDDGGTRYGLIVTCSTDTGFVTCQDDVCRSGRWARRDDVADAGNATGFSPEPAAFAAELTALAGK